MSTDVVVLPDVHAVLFRTLEGDARAAHFRHAEGVVRLDAEHVLDAPARILRVWFGADYERAEFRVPAGVDALFAHHLIQAGGVGRDGVHHGGAEVREELELAQGIAGGGRDREHPHPLGPVLEAETAGEHPVPGRVLEHVLRTAAHHPQATGDGFGPRLQVFLRVQDDRGIAGSAAGGVQANTSVQRNGGHPEGIRIPEILLRGERDLPEIIERPDVRRRQTGLAETLPVERRVHAMPDRGLQPLELQGLDIGTGVRLLRMEKLLVGHDR